MNGENIMCLEWWMGKFIHPYFSSVWDFHSHLERENFKNVKKCWTVIRKSGKYSKKFWTLATRGAIDQWHPWWRHQGCHCSMAPLVALGIGIFHPLVNILIFLSSHGNGPIPYWGEIGMGFFPTTGEAGSGGKENFPMNHERHIIFSPWMALQE